MPYDQEYQKRYYREHREKRLEQSKKRAREMTPEQKEARRQYMRAYWLAHPEKWERTREQRDEVNARRRELYAQDEWRRVKAREASKKWQASNPDKRKAQRLRVYDITPGEYDELLSVQDGACAICKNEPSGKGLFVDHDHDTGVVRGLLCSTCNFGIGQFKDDVKLLECAIEYLKAHGPAIRRLRRPRPKRYASRPGLR